MMRWNMMRHYPTEAGSCPEDTADTRRCCSHTCSLTHTELRRGGITLFLSSQSTLSTCNKTWSRVGKTQLRVLLCPLAGVSNGRGGAGGTCRQSICKDCLLQCKLTDHDHSPDVFPACWVGWPASAWEASRWGRRRRGGRCRGARWPPSTTSGTPGPASGPPPTA